MSAIVDEAVSGC